MATFANFCKRNKQATNQRFLKKMLKKPFYRKNLSYKAKFTLYTDRYCID